MVLTNRQTTTFLTDADQMGIPPATVTELAAEGIVSVDDLADFDAEGIKQIKANLRGATLIPNPAAPGGMIPGPRLIFGAKSMQRLTIAAKAVRYYQAVGRDLTAANMRWNNTLKCFAEHIKALEKKAKDDTPAVPKITKAMPIAKWSESFAIHLTVVLGCRQVPLAYLIRDTVEVPAVPDPLMVGKPYCEEHGSIVNELIARASHDHDMYAEDNGALFVLLDEATRGTSYYASISPFKRRNDGRGAWNALIAQYVGKDKWERELKKQENFIHTFVWKGNTNMTLESFVAKHRAAHVSMQRCAENVDFQLPNERSRVTKLLDAISNADPALQAALAHVRATEEMMTDFEATAAYILPADPVANKRGKSRQRPVHEISGVSGDLVQRGKSGVEYRYYKPDEYATLNGDQRSELRDYRMSSKGSNKGKGKGKRKNDNDENKSKKLKSKQINTIAGQVVAALEAKVVEEDAVKQKDDEKKDEFKQWLVSAISESETIAPARSSATTTHASSTSQLKTILKRVSSKKE